MRRKRKQHTPINEPAHERALREFTDEFGMWRDMYRVSVYQALEGRKLKFLGSHDAEGTNLDFIRDLYGAGKYIVKLLDGGGRWVAQATICLGERRISGSE